MAVLEPAEQFTRSAERTLAVLNGDASIRKFDEILRADKVTPATRSTYLAQLRRVKRKLPADLKCSLGELPEDVLLSVLAQIADKSTGTGFHLTARTLKRFYKSLGRSDLAAKIRIPRARTRLPEIFTDEELRNILEYAGGPDGNLRNRLLVELLWESGCRIGELCNLKIKDIQFHEHYAAIHLNGKTGERVVPVFDSKPDLLEYLNRHPFRNNPHEWFFLTKAGPGGHYHRLTDSGVRTFLADLGRRVLNRRIHPHQFRHTRATQLSRCMTDQELKIFGGWKRTQMLEVYSHLSGKDVTNKLLQLHGIKVEEQELGFKFGIKICRNADCHTENSPLAIYCQKCGHPLAGETVESVLRDQRFIEGLTKNKEFLAALREALKSN